MEDKKVYCRRASELKSIDELGLPEEVVEFLKIDNRPVEVIVAAARLDRDSYDSCMTLLFSDEAWDTLPEDDDRTFSYRDEIVQALERNGFIRRELRSARMIFDILDIFYDPLDDWYYEGVEGERDFYDDGYKLINEKYETFYFSKDKFPRVFEILESWLTKDQYDIMKFDILATAKIGVGDRFHYSDNEESLLKAAQENVRRYLKDEIIECIMS